MTGLRKVPDLVDEKDYQMEPTTEILIERLILHTCNMLDQSVYQREIDLLRVVCNYHRPFL